MKKRYKSLLSKHKHPFLIGAGNILNIAGNYNISHLLKNKIYNDANAIASDWELIGKDILIAKESLSSNKKEKW